ncbi:anti-sigma-V factor RsiV [Robertmurraya siralis]|uniref:Anti-sigma-V factor RsiV n=1 Tax=Robertmurraya siralis TaxID=77777 RepID=A0A920BU80_9BACI|nr:DUF3298 domain-containing protein [Robertmurraya siralis]PAE21124.1 anti-sigma factor [Bacillus sp. 7504-2]GIN62689.1 anti-sigma-V factor RsiV [Robertmurraya siralis]
MSRHKLERLKEQYDHIPIPEELDISIQRVLKKRQARKTSLRLAMAVAAVLMIFTTTVNINPAIAKSLEEIPVLGNIVKVLTVTEYKVDEGNYQVTIDIPEVEMENKQLEKGLNDKYIGESRELYENFMAELETEKVFDREGHLQIESGFEIIMETKQLLSIGRYVEETRGSSMVTKSYDTIDKEKQLLITLPSLFKDDSYIHIISEYIKQQMHEQMKKDSTKIYWVDSSEAGAFTNINKEQNFYINKDHQLVIAFNEYEVAPGYMGPVEFIVPTKQIQSVLVSNEYLK